MRIGMAEGKEKTTRAVQSKKAEKGEDAPACFNRSRLIHKLGNYMVSDVTLGQGTYAKVRLAEHRTTGELYAMKIIKKPEESQRKIYKRIKREVENMKELEHENIVGLIDVFQTNRFICIVMEFAERGDLFEHISTQANGRLTEELALTLFEQMLRAVDHCHRSRVVHRDLKPENILLDANLNVKIADFGFSRTFDPNGALLSTCCGSVGYAAPELLLGEKYTGPSADLWSLGVILYTMLVGVGPFNIEASGLTKRVEERMLSGDFIRSPLLSSKALAILDNVFEPEPSRRATAGQLLKLLHPTAMKAVTATRGGDVALARCARVMSSPVVAARPVAA